MLLRNTNSILTRIEYSCHTCQSYFARWNKKAITACGYGVGCVGALSGNWLVPEQRISLQWRCRPDYEHCQEIAR